MRKLENIENDIKPGNSAPVIGILAQVCLNIFSTISSETNSNRLLLICSLMSAEAAINNNLDI